MRKLLWACSTVVLLVGCNHSAPTTPADGGVAATVNGDAIPLPDFYEHMGMKQTVQVETGKGASQVRVIGSFGLQTLQELVDQKILLQMAQDQKVMPTDAEIDAELKFQTSLRPDYVTVLKDQGLTDEMIRHELTVGLAREHLTMKGVEVSSAEVDAYVKANPSRFSDPATAKILFIQVSSKADQAKVDSELSSGKIFGAVAAQLSQAPHARETGGAYPTDKLSEMPVRLQQLVAKTPANSKSEWVVDGKNFLRFFVVSKKDAKPHAPSEAQRELVRRGIGLQRGEARNHFEQQFYEKLRSSKVDVNIPYLKDAWAKTWGRVKPPQ